MATNHIIPLDVIAPDYGKGFFEKAAENPCADCSAPCCRMLLIPHPTPATYMDLDYIRYMTGFHGVKIILTHEGRWQVMVEQTCRLLDQATNRCTVHDTPRKPKTCLYFNPHRCWYRRNFASDHQPDVITMDLESLESILEHVRFDGAGNITALPSYESIRELVTRTGRAQVGAPELSRADEGVGLRHGVDLLEGVPA